MHRVVCHFSMRTASGHPDSNSEETPLGSKEHACHSSGVGKAGREGSDLHVCDAPGPCSGLNPPRRKRLRPFALERSGEVAGLWGILSEMARWRAKRERKECHTQHAQTFELRRCLGLCVVLRLHTGGFVECTFMHLHTRMVERMRALT